MKTKAELKNILNDDIVNVVFTKKDGTERSMKCTLRENLLPKQEIKEDTDPKKERKENPDVLAVYDLEAKGWRSFRIDSVKTINVLELTK